ncbi:MAG: hypothetical protein KF866_08630 [Phycisphaeraceae bacterium]|nr:hypothetical protein [Phycisphaeraceae bacterium]
MRFGCKAVLALMSAAVAAPSALAQPDLMVVQSTNRHVMLVSGFDGSVIDPVFIDMSVQAGTPIHALVVGDEVWVTNQTTDAIQRYDLATRTYIASITGAMDNIRGFEVVGNTAYVSNAGTQNGAPGLAVVTVDVPSASVTGFWRVGPALNGNPFDVLLWQGNLLVNDITGNNIEVHDLSGNWIRTLHNSDGVSGVDFPEQMVVTSANTILCAGFSPPIGIFEYDANGNQINYWPVGNGNRGVAELGNGDIIFTSGQGLFSLSRATGLATPIVTGISGRYISLAGAPVCRADLSGSSDPNDPDYGVPDGNVDAADFFYYLDQFVAGNLAVADLSGSSDPNDPGYGVPDGQIDAADFFYFLDIFVAGCP